MPLTPSSSPALDGKSVRELQSLAAEAALPAAPPRRPALSRAALLHLIDQLSRWGGSGLAIFAGAAIFMVMVIARDLPLRATAFALLIFGSLYLCRRYRKEFRRGDKIASRPFRWRSYYASTLAVVSAAFGAGAFLLLPEGADPQTIMQTLALMVVATSIAAAFHIAHRAAAAAAAGPALLAIIAAAYLGLGVTLFSNILAAAGLAVCAFLVLATWEAEKRAAARFPRSGFVRRGIKRPHAQPQSGAADLAAAG